MIVNPSIFREYDIRGIAGKDFSQKALVEYEKWYGKFPGITITPEVAEALGRAYGSIISQRGGGSIIIGHEIRPYGQELKMLFAKGVRSTGVNVIDAGESLTPIIYFATAYYKLAGGVNVTGSHNVYFFNGFKMMGRSVAPVYGENIQKMREMIEKDEFVIAKEGSYTKQSIFQDYKRYLLENNKLHRRLKVVIDCGNGSAGDFVPQLLTEMGVELVGIYTTPDSSFPNHLPDPEDKELMKDLMAKVKETKADIGIAFDADADRCGVVDETGEFIYSDRILLWLAQDMLSRNPGKKVLYDVKCTRLLEELIPKFGGVPMMHVTGHAPIKDTMRKDLDVYLGGEVSGHFYYAENYFRIDDGVYSACKLLSLLSNTDKTVSQINSQFPTTIMTPEIKLPCEDSIKHKVVGNITKVFSSKYETITIDGSRVKFSPTSWGLVRASNTSPYLTIRFEADDETELLRMKNLFADELEKYSEIGDKLDRVQVTSRTGRLGWV